MAIQNLSDLNKLRKEKYYKNPEEEGFLLHLNKYLQQKEISEYKENPEKHIWLFVFGLPRSGTTVLAQVLAHSFDVGFINNFMARFWLAPVMGIKLSQVIYNQQKSSSFESEYAGTSNIQDIHEFGYFWRYWLKKDKVADYLDIKKTEKSIQWDNLRKTLLNIQATFDKSICMKNIFGAFHIEKFISILEKVIFIYIERDPLDNAISILEARKKFYADINTWWSIIPPEFERLKNLSYMDQIAGQIYYLRKLYENQINKLGENHIIRIKYKDLCDEPEMVLQRIKQKASENWNYTLNLVNVPSKFRYKTHNETGLKKEFEEKIKRFQE
ncbi:sulfotransferase [Bacteroidota bacterium]